MFSVTVNGRTTRYDQTDAFYQSIRHNNAATRPDENGQATNNVVWKDETDGVILSETTKGQRVGCSS